MAETLLCEKVGASRAAFLELDASLWAQAKTFTLEMTATPLANQPSPYIKATRNQNEIGKVKALKTSVLHNGKELFFSFEWSSTEPNFEIGDLDVFPDGVAVLFAMDDTKECPIKEMGSEDSPTNSWFWRADYDNKPKNQVAHGLATTLYTEVSSIVANSRWKSGVWQVVMGRAFTVADDHEESVQLKVGSPKRVGFAAWEGANGERGGIKAFSKEWRELIIAT